MIDKIKLESGLEIQENVSLKDYTTFKIGGPAKFFVSVDNKNDLRKALQTALDFKLKYFILGGGSNVLFPDEGFDGLVIRTKDTNDAETQIKNNLVTAFCGTHWPTLVRETVKQGFGGLEFSANIPGVVGGCVRGNAGAYGLAVGDFVKEVEVLVIDENEITLKVLQHDECEFEYRESIFKKNKNWIISEVMFELIPNEKDSATIMQEIIQEGKTRCDKQPLSYPSAGCSFKNVEYNNSLSKYSDWQVHGKIPAAKLIDEAGLKGQQIGGAKISEEHANFIINVDNATAKDVKELIELVKTKVLKQFGILLVEEVQMV